MRSDIKEYLNEISDITLHIMFLYKTLIRMDQDGEKGTKEYHNMLQYLDLTIQEEEALYTFFALNVNLTMEAYAYLFGKEKNDTDPFAIIVNHDEKSLVLKRIKQKLKAIIEGEPQYFIRSLKEDDLEAIADEDEFDGLLYLYEIFPTLEASAYTRINGFIEEVLIKEKNQTIHNYLLKTKYFFAFLNSALEKLYLENGFDKVPNKFDEEITLPGMNIGKDTEKKVRDLRGLSLVFEASNILFNQTDNDYRNLSNYQKNMVYTIILRTGFLYLSDEMADNAHCDLLLTIEENDCSENYQYARQIVEAIFKNIDDSLKVVNQDLNSKPQFD